MRKFIYLFLSVMAASALVIVDTGCTAKAKRAYHLRQANHYFDAAEYGNAELEYKNVLRGEKNDQAISRLGKIYFEQGRYISAIPLFLLSIPLATNDLDLHLKWGLICLNFNDWKDAQEQASFVLDKNPLNEEAPQLLARSAINKIQIDEIRLRLQKLAQTGDKASFEVGLGTLSLREGDFKTAETAFKRAQALDPKSSLAYSALGALYWQEKDLQQADAALKTAFDLSPPRSPRRLEYARFKIKTGDMEAAKSILEEMVKIIPDYVPAWLDLANMAAAQKRYDDSTAFLSKVLALDPENYDAMMLDGELKLARGQTADAITEFEQLSKIQIYGWVPDLLPPVYYKLGLAYNANNDFKNAMNSLSQAVNLNTNYTDAIYLLAEIQVNTKDFNAAVTSLKGLIQQQPQMPEAQLLLADAFRGQRNFDSALTIYQRLEKALPTNSLIPLYKGGTFLQQNNAAEARKAFTRTLELDPDNWRAISELVNLDLNEKQYAAAIQRAEQYVDKNPKLVKPRLILANVFISQTNNQLAEAVLLKAIEFQPDSSDAHLMLAQLYFYSKPKQDEKALAELKIVTTKYPTNTLALILSGEIFKYRKDSQAAADTYEKIMAAQLLNGQTNSPEALVALGNLAYLYSEKLNRLDTAYNDAQQAMKMAQQARDSAQQLRDLQPDDQSRVVALASSEFILATSADTLGWIIYQQGQYASALSLLQGSVNILLINKLPMDPEIQFHLGMINYMMGEEDSAHAALQSAFELSTDFPGRDECEQCLKLLAIDPKTANADARATLEKRVSEKPDDQVALVRLAAIYQRVGAVDKAIATYETALKSNSKNATTLVNLAQLYSSKDVQKALGLARDAYKLSPNDDQVASTLGRLAYATGNYKLAFNLLKQTAQDQPGSPAMQYDYAKAAYSMGRVPEAAAAMQTALQIGLPSAQTAEATRLLEMINLAANPDQAAAAISQVEEILKSDANYLPALMVMAVINERKNDIATAQLAYEKVLALYPDFAPAQKQLVILYAKDPNNKEKAYTLAIKARETFPDDSELAKAFAIIVFQQGNYTQAVKLLQASADRRSADPELLYYLGMAQYHLKNFADCKKNLQQSLNLNLSAQFAPEAKRVLVELNKS